MFDPSFLIKGLIIGLSIAAAVGPIAILCIDKTMTRGFKAGFSVGLGAAVADACYGAIAGAGLISLSHFLIHYADLISLVGSLFLCWLGIKTYTSYFEHPSKKNIDARSLKSLFVTSFILTLSSPFTILLFTAIFSSLGFIDNALDQLNAISLVLGVFAGSTCWWLLLSGGVELIREKISSALLKRINQVSAVLLLLFAAYAFLRAYLHIIN